MIAQLDPNCIYFTHSRIRPLFTGCGKSIHTTLAEIEQGVTAIDDIPLISVIVNDGHYFSMNNRRLYLFKVLREKGCLPDNMVSVRVKPPLEREKLRYTPQKCSITCTLMGMKGDLDGDAYDDDVDESEVSVEKKPQISFNDLPKAVKNRMKEFIKLKNKNKEDVITNELNTLVSTNTISTEQRLFILDQL